MAEYRRFVAYVYEYLKGKKGSNCGFIRVEAWGKVCRMEIHLRCPGLLAGTECSVYGFVRKKGLLDGSRIGNCRTEEGKMDCLLETETMAVGQGKIPLGEMNGMVLILESGGFFGTEWDDQPIRPEDFRVMPEARKEPKSDGESKRVGTEEGKTDRGGQEQETEDAKLMGSLHNNVENAGEDERDIVDGNITEQSAGEGAMKSQDKSSQDMDTSRPEIHTQSIEGQEIEEYPRPPYGPGPEDRIARRMVRCRENRIIHRSHRAHRISQGRVIRYRRRCRVQVAQYHPRRRVHHTCPGRLVHRSLSVPHVTHLTMAS